MADYNFSYHRVDSSSLLRLPSDVLAFIYSLLGILDQSSFALTAARLCRVARNHRFRAVHLFRINTECILNLFDYAPLHNFIREVTIVRPRKCDEVSIKKILRGATRLQSLKWADSLIPEDLCESLYNCPLVHLQILVPLSWQAFPVPNRWRLRSLHILSAEDFLKPMLIAPILRRFTKSLEILFFPLHSDHVEMLQQMTVLKVLGTTAPCCINVLTKIIPRLPDTVHSLTLEFIGASLPMSMVKGLSNLPKLEMVHLDGTNFTLDEAAISYTLSSLQNNGNISFHWSSGIELHGRDALGLLNQLVKGYQRYVNTSASI